MGKKIGGIRLRTAGELDNYIFADDKHARDWLSQGFVNDKEYSVEVISYRKRDCCGEAYAIKVVTRMVASEFLDDGAKHV